MYTFSDIIKSKFLEEFTQISVGSMVTALVLACILACYIVLVYRVTYRGVLFNPNFALSLILLSMITSLAILTVTSNVVLSLGMVGALSIVRFRTAVKDPMDTIYMFWAIVCGITTGAGLTIISVIGTLLIGLVFLVVGLCAGKVKASSWLMIIRYDSNAIEAVRKAVAGMRSRRVKSMAAREDGTCELVIELRSTKDIQRETVSLREIPGVREVTAAAYTGSTML